jgi:N-acetylmuramoyl-L-alanine amidase
MSHATATLRLVIPALLAISLAAPAAAQRTAPARAAYQQLLAKERALTANGRPPSAAAVRALIAQYQHFAGRYARTGYADNALWQAARLAGMLGDRLDREADRQTARRLLEHLIRGYPSSSLLPEARVALRTIRTARPATARASRPATAAPVPPPATGATQPEPVPATSTVLDGAAETAAELSVDAVVAAARLDDAAAPAPPPGPEVPRATLTDVRRSVLPELVRITLEISREIAYHDERLDGPPRVFFDLSSTAAGAAFADGFLSFPDDVVRQIRVGERPDGTTRVVLDLEDGARYSVFTLYNPFRLVVDVYRAADAARVLDTSPALPAGDLTALRPASAVPATRPLTPVVAASPLPADLREPAAPVAPAANASGSFSLARQLGLNVSRIVIDPGHGGHDPGALGKRISEAELVLDVALRLEQLLLKSRGFDVLLTRRKNVFVPLEERTAMANRAHADLFLSIHANASRRTAARGIETYILNFASNADAEAVAARENAASGRSMHQLPDIVKAIALNNKLDESREFASVVQASLASRLGASDNGLRDLGVKQAPFVVLIGAGMPSVLAEISFITNPKDAQLLRTAAYRQKIAESLYDAIVKYQRALKASETVASQ